MLEIIGWIVRAVGAIVRAGVDAGRIALEQKAAEEVAQKRKDRAEAEAEYKKEVAHEQTKAALLKAVGAKISADRPVENNNAMWLLLFLVLVTGGTVLYIRNK